MSSPPPLSNRFRDLRGVRLRPRERDADGAPVRPARHRLPDDAGLHLGQGERGHERGRHGAVARRPHPVGRQQLRAAARRALGARLGRGAAGRRDGEGDEDARDGQRG